MLDLAGRLAAAWGLQKDIRYGVAWVSRIDKIIGLFCKGALLKRRYSAKETYNFIEPADCSHPISILFESVFYSIWVKCLFYLSSCSKTSVVVYAVCHSVLWRVAVCCSVLWRVAVCCSVLQCVAVCCSRCIFTTARHLLYLVYMVYIVTSAVERAYSICEARG